MATTKRWTIDEVACLPDDGFRYSVIRGELFRNPPRVARQGRCVAAVGRYLANFVIPHGLGAVYGPCGFILGRNPDTLLEPDVAFVQTARVPPREDNYPELAPDLVVDVVESWQTSPPMESKVRCYLRAGVRLAWVAYPAHGSVRIHRSDESHRCLSASESLDGEDVLPGFRLPLAQLFT